MIPHIYDGLRVAIDYQFKSTTTRIKAYKTPLKSSKFMAGNKKKNCRNPLMHSFMRVCALHIVLSVWAVATGMIGAKRINRTRTTIWKAVNGRWPGWISHPNVFISYQKLWIVKKTASCFQRSGKICCFTGTFLHKFLQSLIYLLSQLIWAHLILSRKSAQKTR